MVRTHSVSAIPVDIGPAGDAARRHPQRMTLLGRAHRRRLRRPVPAACGSARRRQTACAPPQHPGGIRIAGAARQPVQHRYGCRRDVVLVVRSVGCGQFETWLPAYQMPAHHCVTSARCGTEDTAIWTRGQLQCLQGTEGEIRPRRDLDNVGQRAVEVERTPELPGDQAVGRPVPVTRRAAAMRRSPVRTRPHTVSAPSRLMRPDTHGAVDTT